MTSPDDNHPQLDREVAMNRLLFCGAFAGGVDSQRLVFAVADAPVSPRDRRALQRLVADVSRTARAFALLSDDARERLGIPRWEHRIDAARGMIDGAR